MQARAIRLFGTDVEIRDYFPLLRWMIFTGVVADTSKISFVILVLYAGTSLHCLYQVLAVSREINKAHRAQARIEQGVPSYKVVGNKVYAGDGFALEPSLLSQHVRNLVLKSQHQGRQRLDQTLLLRGLADTMRAPLTFGSYAGDSVLKLGLLGTIVGFILMLIPIGGLDTFDAATMKSSMRLMGDGMAVAMYTTLAGLIGSILIKAQYYILDDSIGYLFGVTTNLTEVFVVSTLERDGGGRV
jgi:biopolymer transport protein ExbB/TolQ